MSYIDVYTTILYNSYYIILNGRRFENRWKGNYIVYIAGVVLKFIMRKI